MNQKSNKIAVCFLAAALLAGIAYMFVNLVQAPESSQEESSDPDHEHFIAMTPEQVQEENIPLLPAGPGQLQHIIYAPGTIELNSNQLIHIVPAASGVVKQASKNVGETVRKGEIAAILDSQEMAELKSSYLDKQQKQRQASANLVREKNLRDKNISSEQDFQDRRSESSQAEIELELAKQKLQLMGLSPKEIAQVEKLAPSALRLYEIRSPVTGTVMEKKITRGAIAQKESEIYVIADLSSVSAEISLFPQDMSLVKKGLQAAISSPYGNSTTGSIVFIAPYVNPETHTQTVTALIENADNVWKPGTYIQAAIASEPENAPIVIPKEAIQKIGQEDCVFVAKENGFEIRPVRPGRSDEQRVEIVSGLLPGEVYASGNTFILKAEQGKDEAQHMD